MITWPVALGFLLGAFVGGSVGVIVGALLGSRPRGYGGVVRYTEEPRNPVPPSMRGR